MLLWVAGCGWISAADRDHRWDLDHDGVERPADCDDGDPDVRGAVAWCRDLDGDGLGDPATAVVRCDPPAGWVDDCSDPDDPGTPAEACGDPPTVGLSVSAVAVERDRALTATATGSGSRWTFDFGDGALSTGGVERTADHSYTDSGFRILTVVATDPCGQTSAAQAWVAVSEPGALLVVTTGADEADPEQPSTAEGWLGAGLSLREALTLADATAGTQVITFAPGLGAVAIGRNLPDYDDPDGALVGSGVEVTGGGLKISGSGSVVAGLRLVGVVFDPAALELKGADTVARGVEVTGGGVAVRLAGDGSLLVDSVVSGNDDPQIEVKARATVSATTLVDGRGRGAKVDADGAVFRLCRILGNLGDGVDVSKHVSRVTITDSTLTGNGGDGVSVGQKVEEVDLRNVILAANGGWGLGGSPRSFVNGSPDYDVWDGNGSGACEGCEVGDHSVLADPLLVEPSSDATPLPGSPAIDAGTPATGVDRDGPDLGRFWGLGPDIGAVEVRIVDPPVGPLARPR